MPVPLIVADPPLEIEIALIVAVFPAAAISRTPPVPVNSATMGEEPLVERVAPLLATMTGWLEMLPTLPTESSTRVR